MIENNFRICIIVPPGYKHSLCFIEVGFLLKNSLISCGKSCDITLNDLAKDKINILLGWHLLAFKEEYASLCYIPYQLEQLGPDTWNGFSPDAKKILSHGREVWDYSIENIEFLKAQGINARHLPVGYHPCLEQIPPDQPKDIDVLFFGSMGERRQKVLNSLQYDKKLKLHTLFGVYGKERDLFIARSKIILNIHFYSAKIFEAVRISYLLNNRCCVISEESLINPYPLVTVKMFPYERLAQACGEYAGNTMEIERIRKTNFEEFRQHYPMPELLQKIVS